MTAAISETRLAEIGRWLVEEPYLRVAELMDALAAAEADKARAEAEADLWRVKVSDAQHRATAAEAKAERAEEALRETLIAARGLLYHDSDRAADKVERLLARFDAIEEGSVPDVSKTAPGSAASSSGEGGQG